MRIAVSIIALVLAAMLAAITTANVADARETIFKKRSLYRNMSVIDDDELRCLQFTTRRRATSQQSCLLKDDPDRLVLEYSKLVFAGLLFNDQPKRILVLGLGGGSIPDTFRKILPDAEIISVEIDPAVVDVAEEYFGFQPTEKMRVVEADGRVYVKRAVKRGDKYDFIVLDAFNGDYIPEHLMTVEFLRECRELLSPGGVLAANTFSSSRLYKHESATYMAAFGEFLAVTRNAGNRMIFAGADLDLDAERLRNAGRDARFEGLSRYGIDLSNLGIITHSREIKTRRARVLTDQYAPANLLNTE